MSVGYTEDTGIIDNLKGFNRITARYNSEYKASASVSSDLMLVGLMRNLMILETVTTAQSPIRAMYDYNPYEPFLQEMQLVT
jgi:hypothetical protein